MHTLLRKWYCLFSLCPITNSWVCQWQENPIHIHMQDNTYFLSHHILPQAAPVWCEYKCQNAQRAVKTLSFSEAPVPCESNTDRIWLFTDFGWRKAVWGEFHCPHVQSCMRCKYWISLQCRCCIMAPQHVSAVSIMPLGESFRSALQELLNWLWDDMPFVYCIVHALATARSKFFFTCLAVTVRVRWTRSVLCRIGFKCFGVWAAWGLCVCMYLMSCLYFITSNFSSSIYGIDKLHPEDATTDSHVYYFVMNVTCSQNH